MRLSLLLCTLLTTLTTAAQSDTHPKALPLENVTLLDSPFKRAEQLDIRYLLTLDADRLLAPYRKEAGLPPKAENYPNWENTGLDGHIGGHYLSALAQMYASTQNPKIGKRMNYMLDELATFQAELAVKEASAGALQQATTDVVFCGEQQPESNHLTITIERAGHHTTPAIYEVRLVR